MIKKLLFLKQWSDPLFILTPNLGFPSLIMLSPSHTTHFYPSFLSKDLPELSVLLNSSSVFTSASHPVL
jgi:hypothetical protein